MEERAIPEQEEERAALGAEGEDIESLKKALAEERSQAEGYLANWQRAQADYLNLKRRTEQEREEVTKFANGMLILNLLPALDDLERAFNSLPPEVAGLDWMEGIRLIYHKLQSVLEAQGVSPIKAVGEAFDPNIHEAVMSAAGEDGIVIEEVKKGYKLYDRVIRPSKIIVGKGKTTEGG